MWQETIEIPCELRQRCREGRPHPELEQAAGGGISPGQAVVCFGKASATTQTGKHAAARPDWVMYHLLRTALARPDTFTGFQEQAPASFRHEIRSHDAQCDSNEAIEDHILARLTSWSITTAGPSTRASRWIMTTKVPERAFSVRCA
jgi:hypothetical protein